MIYNFNKMDAISRDNWRTAQVMITCILWHCFHSVCRILWWLWHVNRPRGMAAGPETTQAACLTIRHIALRYHVCITSSPINTPPYDYTTPNTIHQVSILLCIAWYILMNYFKKPCCGVGARDVLTFIEGFRRANYLGVLYQWSQQLPQNFVGSFKLTCQLFTG